MKNHSLRNLILLLQGQFVSNLGNQIYDIAMLLWIKELTGSAAFMGVAMLLTNLPEAVLAPFGGALADRFGKLRTIIISDVVSGLSLIIVLLASLLPTGIGTKLAALSITNLLLGVSAACFVPAVSALLPSLSTEDRLEKANAVNQFGNVGARVIGQSAGAFIYSILGVVFAFGINAASFLLSALSETFIRLKSTESQPRSVEKGMKPILADLGTTVKKVWQTPHLLRLILYIAAFHFCLSSLPILLPFFAEHRLHLAHQWVGFLYGSYTIGIMLGFVVAGTLPSRIFKRYQIIAGSAVFTGAAFITTGLAVQMWVALISLTGIGLGIGVIVVNLLTELQLSAPEAERGRTMGIAHAFGSASLPIGMALFGLLLDGMHAYGSSYEKIIPTILLACGVSAVLLGLALMRTPQKAGSL